MAKASLHFLKTAHYSALRHYYQMVHFRAGAVLQFYNYAFTGSGAFTWPKAENMFFNNLLHRSFSRVVQFDGIVFLTMGFPIFTKAVNVGMFESGRNVDL